jgi:hypothetical protein
MKSKTDRGYSSKSSFLRESSKESYKGINNAYDLNRTGHYCGGKSDYYSKNSN